MAVFEVECHVPGGGVIRRAGSKSKEAKRDDVAFMRYIGHGGTHCLRGAWLLTGYMDRGLVLPPRSPMHAPGCVACGQNNPLDRYIEVIAADERVVGITAMCTGRVTLRSCRGGEVCSRAVIDHSHSRCLER